jgi:hypothetical protein
MKSIKISAHFEKYPRDIIYFPTYLVFGYWFTLVKLWELLTWWNASWALAQVVDTPKEGKRASLNKKGYLVGFKSKVPNALESLNRRRWAQMGRLHHKALKLPTASRCTVQIEFELVFLTQNCCNDVSRPNRMLVNIQATPFVTSTSKVHIPTFATHQHNKQALAAIHHMTTSHPSILFFVAHS